jgi:hypothetical protein
MKCHQLPGGTWQSRYAGANRNIDPLPDIEQPIPFALATISTRKRIS